nr:PREDICTED: uncharacterized protein LOC106705166 [Latimeria chalumnae]|eukprot:XP_014349374.1 PREDICTED: uncharacterized protein LOC106705166 [Latimeria chalumnae]
MERKGKAGSSGPRRDVLVKSVSLVLLDPLVTLDAPDCREHPGLMVQWDQKALRASQDFQDHLVHLESQQMEVEIFRVQQLALQVLLGSGEHQALRVTPVAKVSLENLVWRGQRESLVSQVHRGQ